MRKVIALALVIAIAATAPATAAAGNDDVRASFASTREYIASQSSNQLNPSLRQDLLGRLTVARDRYEESQLCLASDGLLEMLATIDRARAELQRRISEPTTSSGDAQIFAERLRVLDSIRYRVAGLRFDIVASLPSGSACGGGVSATVDAAVARPTATLPGMDGVARKLSAMVDTRGNESMFVSDEVVMTSDNHAEVLAATAQMGGRIIHSYAAADAGLDSSLRVYLIKVDPSKFDTGSLDADLTSLAGDISGILKVSDPSGLGTLAAVAGATAHTSGLKASVNWVTEPAALSGGTTREHPTGPAGFSADGTWNPNAFQWTHLRDDGPHSIGVPESWKLLSRLKYWRTKDIAIIDGGYIRSPDMRPDVQTASIVPFTETFGAPNPIAPWHGAEVYDTAMAIPDNGYGGAGTAGEWASPILIYGPGEMYGLTVGIGTAMAMGGDIFNISTGFPVPASLFWTVTPFEILMVLYDENAIILASAGNEGVDVDENDCFIVCWEASVWAPCEMAGIICVGGLSKYGNYPHQGSNYGSDNDYASVQIYAPFEVVVGSNPHTDADAQIVKGTSFSSPYVAGVAALIWAADFRLDNGEVEDILLSEANTNPVTSWGGYPGGGRAVDAYKAVTNVLPADIEIESPLDGYRGNAGRLELGAFVYTDGGTLSDVVWTLEDGTEIGRGERTRSSVISSGAHTITATARLTSGRTLVDSVEVVLNNVLATMRIDAPTDGQEVASTADLVLRGSSYDPETNAPLSNTSVEWYVDDSITPALVGHEGRISMSGLAVGPHRLTFATNDEGTLVTDEVGFVVVPGPSDPPPSATINAPANGTDFLADQVDPATMKSYVNVRLLGSATDTGPTAGGALVYVWYDSVDGGPRVEIARGPDRTVRLYQEHAGMESTTHELTLEVMDPAGGIGRDTVRVKVGLLI
jgi:serine protease